MKKNKRSRIFRRVLSRLSWADFYRVNDESRNAYKEVLAAKRSLEECGCENVKVEFYNHVFHLHFELYHPGQECNRYYTVSGGYGYANRYRVTNWCNVNRLTEQLEQEYSRTLRHDFHDYCMFREVIGDVLFDGLTTSEYVDYCFNGGISSVPYDVAIKLWRDLRECLGCIVNESVAYKKVDL